MKRLRALAGLALAGAVMSASGAARADKAADDFLNPQDMGPRLSIMPLIGPGLRVNYDHRFELEKDVSELRTQVIGDVVFPFAEASANVDVRLFLLTFGASVGYHDEWHVLQYRPNYDTEPVTRAGRDPQGNPNQVQIVDTQFGKDMAGQRREATEVAALVGPKGFSDLDRDARRVKDQNADVQTGQWGWYEGRVGFIWPAQNFIAVSTAALRNENRPDVSYDWANATVLNGGWHLRWETYAFFRDPAIGFIGPALRIMNVPRNRVPRDISLTVNGETGRVLREGDACQPSPGFRLGTPPAAGEPAPALRLPCEEVRETELHYGFIGGLRTNWVTSGDVFLARVYTTAGLNNSLFGTHVFGIPLQLLFAYQVDVDF